MFLSDWPDLLRFRSLLRNLIAKDLKVKYRGSYLGLMWSLLNPLTLILVYSIVLQYVFRAPIENLPLLVITGVIPWIFFSTTTISSTDSIITNAGLVKRISFPREILPLSTVFFNLIQHLLALAVFFPAILYFKRSLPWTITLLPLVLALLVLFVLGVALLLSAVTTFYKDVRYLTEVSMMVVFWCTPVVYEHNRLPEWFLWLNPLGSFFASYQNIVYFERVPQVDHIIGMVGWAVGLFLIGNLTFRRTQRRFAEEL